MEENKEKPVKFVYDPDMTLAERLQAQREQMQNLREQEELKRMLANQDKVMYKISRRRQDEQKVKEKIKSPEEQIEDLRYKESELLEKEYKIDGDLKKVTEYYESVESDSFRLSLATCAIYDSGNRLTVLPTASDSSFPPCAKGRRTLSE